jgi:hypothetical protein
VTLTELLAKYPTTRQNTRIPARADATEPDQWGRNASHWNVLLTSHDAPEDGSEGYMMPPRAAVAVEYSQGSAIKTPPDVRQVIASLISDANCVAGYTDIDDFAAEMGIEKPGEAYRTWEACKLAGKKLQTLYGRYFDATSIDTEDC